MGLPPTSGVTIGRDAPEPAIAAKSRDGVLGRGHRLVLRPALNVNERTRNHRHAPLS